jgi:hypothetical protein
MKRLATQIAPLLGVLLLAGLALATDGFASKNPAPEGSPAYRHYVGCGLSENAELTHRCPKKSKKGAFFESLKGDVFYTVCVKFPSKKSLCAPKQEAKQGTLYVNKITSNIPGRHKVAWFVKGQRVGVFEFVVAE